EGMEEEFRTVVRKLRFGEGKIPIVSNETGKVASARELAEPEYWVRQVRRAVRFADGMRTLEAEGATTYVEVGPQAVLSAMGQECLSEAGQAKAAFLPALRKERPEVETLLAALGGLHGRGHEVDWERFYAPLGARVVSLPTYAFERQRYWLEAPKTTG